MWPDLDNRCTSFPSLVSFKLLSITQKKHFKWEQCLIGSCREKQSPPPLLWLFATWSVLLFWVDNDNVRKHKYSQRRKRREKSRLVLLPGTKNPQRFPKTHVVRRDVAFTMLSERSHQPDSWCSDAFGMPPPDLETRTGIRLNQATKLAACSLYRTSHALIVTASYSWRGHRFH